MHAFPYMQCGTDLIFILLWWSCKAVTTSASGCQQHKMDDGAWPKTKEQTQAFCLSRFFFLIAYNTASGDWLREVDLLQNAELMDRPASRPQRQNRWGGGGGEGAQWRGTMTNSWKGKQGQMTYSIPSRANTYLDLCKYTHQHLVLLWWTSFPMLLSRSLVTGSES